MLVSEKFTSRHSLRAWLLYDKVSRAPDPQRTVERLLHAGLSRRQHRQPCRLHDSLPWRLLAACGVGGSAGKNAFGGEKNCLPRHRRSGEGTTGSLPDVTEKRGIFRGASASNDHLGVSRDNRRGNHYVHAPARRLRSTASSAGIFTFTTWAWSVRFCLRPRGRARRWRATSST